MRALSEAYNDKRTQEAEKEARLFAMMANVMAGAKDGKPWTSKDFFDPDKEQEPDISDEQRQATKQAYEDALATSRKLYAEKHGARGDQENSTASEST